MQEKPYGAFLTHQPVTWNRAPQRIIPAFINTRVVTERGHGSLLPRGTEISQVRRRLVLVNWHQVAIGTSEVSFLADDDVVVVLGAKIFGPDRIALAIVVPRHCPGADQRIIDRRDLVMQEVAVGLVEVESLLDDRPVVVVHQGATL